MQGKNHVTLGLAAGLLWPVAPPTPAAWAGLILGSLAPDLDGCGHIAYTGNLLPGFAPGWMKKGLNFIGLNVSKTVRAVLGHRGPLHWPLWGLLLWLIGANAGLPWLQWFGFGFVTHILGDALTKSGVPILGPISTRNISLTPMKTGGAVETIFGLVLWGFVGWKLWAVIGSLGYAQDLLKKLAVWKSA